MTMPVLGLDTSNYTTSAAVFDGADGCNAGRLLAVRPGELGLRQRCWRSWRAADCSGT